MEFNYKKYRWFFTKSGKLVYGGKSAEQNEEIIRELVKNKKDFIMMHTKIPGSPFAVIKADVNKVSESDLEETAVWTACFSRAWKKGLKKTEIDVFLTEQLIKKKGMKLGTFGVLNKVDKKDAELKLVLINQKDILRAVPEKTVKANNKKFAKIVSGKISKEEFAKKLAKRLNRGEEEVLNALPTGKFKEIR
ncbi:DUF814 domain-containing protein [Candidatus Pacearchaeota archaeon]|nr:DUF814 domain-containing protein [Candidatus Pacearchaeota archaeon]